MTTRAALKSTLWISVLAVALFALHKADRKLELKACVKCGVYLKEWRTVDSVIHFHWNLANEDETNVLHYCKEHWPGYDLMLRSVPYRYTDKVEVEWDGSAKRCESLHFPIPPGTKFPITNIIYGNLKP